jgi:hypothetical protein
MKLLVTSIAFVLLFSASCQAVEPKLVPVANQRQKDQNLNQVSEIVLERVYSGCNGCGDHRVTLTREKADESSDIKVADVDLHSKKQREGKLSAYYYNTLLKVLESQKYFDMKSEYAMGWEDALQTKITVKLGETVKTIQTRNEGEVPIELRTIYLAIDGAASHVIWTDGQASNVYAN